MLRGSGGQVPAGVSRGAMGRLVRAADTKLPRTSWALRHHTTYMSIATISHTKPTRSRTVSASAVSQSPPLLVVRSNTAATPIPAPVIPCTSSGLCIAVSPRRPRSRYMTSSYCYERRMQRNPRWEVAVSTGWGMRAAGR
jgi:hypothetical protein